MQAIETDLLSGLQHIHKGKVRDTYLLPDGNLLIVASDRISVFDFVLNAQVPRKGEVLTAMNIFWRSKLPEYKHDLVAFGKHIDPHLPKELRDNHEIQKRAVVVQKLQMIPIECIIRGYLTGSGLSAYKRTQSVCGHELPPGLHDGSKLPLPLFTPTTKAEVGHDEHVTATEVGARFGFLPEQMSLSIYTAAAHYGLSKGIIIADTKLELGKLPSGEICIADEVLTPDSSRFWDETEYGIAQTSGKSPKPWDKQVVRDWAKTVGIDTKDPEKSEDQAWVKSQVIPNEILIQTQRIYMAIFLRLVGIGLDLFQREKMGIDD